MRVLGALLLLPALLGADEGPLGKPREGPGAIQIEDPGPVMVDAAVAKQTAARFRDQMKAAHSPEDKSRVLLKLGDWNHREIYKAAARYLRSKDERVAVAAVVVCGRQSACRKQAGAALLKQLHREKRESVACALLVGLGRLGRDGKAAYKAAREIFEKDTSEKHKAAARYFGYIRAKTAFRMLAEKLDEPKNTSPPQGRKKSPVLSEAERKKLWDEWKSNYPHIRWALSQIVEGETFETLAEAKAWAETEGKKLGIKW